MTSPFLSEADADRPQGSWDSAIFRSVLGHFCSGVTVITAQVGGNAVGLTCQSFFSVSIAPPLVAMSVGLNSTSFPAIRERGSCCVNILSAEQVSISNAFARSATNKWQGVDWDPSSELGHPVIKGVLAWLECELEDELVAGDHRLVVARVNNLHVRQDGAPLLYYRGTYATLAQANGHLVSKG
jgi:flavin reductase (DIM6/NTAB) family NADH-FMN oxidoreductase RutF